VARPSLFFKDFAGECEAARKKVALFNFSSRGKIEVTGTERISFLNSVLSNDIETPGMGEGTYAALLTAQGRVLADMNVYVFANSVLLETEPGLEEKLRQGLEKLHITEEVEIRIATAEFAQLSLQGPKSEALAASLVKGPVRVEKEFHHANVTVFDVPATLVRRSVTGEKGFHLFLAPGNVETVVKRVLELGKPYGVRQAGPEAAEILRIEAGIPRYGVDFDETVMLPETGLEDAAASETKGCYPGQEVVARTKTYGQAPRKLKGLVFEKSAVLPRPGDRILKDGNEAGCGDERLSFVHARKRHCDGAA